MLKRVQEVPQTRLLWNVIAINYAFLAIIIGPVRLEPVLRREGDLLEFLIKTTNIIMIIYI
jgi:hypothetical protein